MESINNTDKVSIDLGVEQTVETEQTRRGSHHGISNIYVSVNNSPGWCANIYRAGLDEHTSRFIVCIALYSFLYVWHLAFFEVNIHKMTK